MLRLNDLNNKVTKVIELTYFCFKRVLKKDIKSYFKKCENDLYLEKYD